VVKVCVKALCAGTVALNEPSRATTVWVTLSSFVQTTVLFTPSTTVMFPGLYAKPLMLTLAELPLTVFVLVQPRAPRGSPTHRRKRGRRRAQLRY
jgi:hypothetical protein